MRSLISFVGGIIVLVVIIALITPLFAFACHRAASEPRASAFTDLGSAFSNFRR